jgi:hypothetical protein
MTSLRGFRERWGTGPLCIYIAGILLPAPIAFLRPDLMPVAGLPVFAVLFWTGPFVSAAAVFWSDWSATWRAAWIALIPILAAPTFIPLVV